MDTGLAGKNVLVTGGAKGIGEAIVRALAEESAVPIIVDLDEPSGARLRDTLVGEGRRCHLVVADLTHTEACARAIAEATDKAGPLHCLVNNAGVNDGVGLRNGSADAFLNSLRKNLLHYYEMTRLMVPALKQAQGSVVNIASKVAVTGQGGTSGYAAAKGAILGLTREWAVDLLDDGVRVNAVVPAEVMTPLYRQWLDTFSDPDEKVASIVSRIPLGRRMTTADEIASMVLFVLSSRSSHITGQHLFVDGGYTHLDRALS